MGTLDGRVAFVTGVARGQGRSHAVKLAEEGADIIGIDALVDEPTVHYPLATKSDLDETAELVESLGRRAILSQADIRDLPTLTAAVDAGVASLGRLDVIVANAGIFSLGAVLDLPERAWQDMIDVNLTGEWHAAKAAIPHLRAGGRGGSMILTSSELGLRAQPNTGHYTAAKHGVVGLMRTLALELAPDFIRVNSIHPTTVNTPMVMNSATYRLFRPDLENPTADDMAEASRAVNALPIPWVEPTDISNAVLWLASDESRYVTGITLPVDAGWLVK